MKDLQSVGKLLITYDLLEDLLKREPSVPRDLKIRKVYESRGDYRKFKYR